MATRIKELRIRGWMIGGLICILVRSTLGGNWPASANAHDQLTPRWNLIVHTCRASFTRAALRAQGHVVMIVGRAASFFL